jgi:hypothetical protein
MKTISYLALFIAIVAVNNIISFTPKTGISPYYAVMLVALLLCLLFDTRLRFNLAMTCLYVVCALSIAFNEIPAFFTPWTRLVIFIVVSALVSPFIQSQALCRFRILTFRYIQWGLVGVVLLSFLSRFLGFGVYQGGYFSGIADHSMLLAPIAAMTFLFLLYLYFDNQMPLAKWGRLTMIGLMPISVLLMLMAASRTAFIAMIIASLVFLYQIGQKRLGKMLKWVMAAGCLVLLTFPLWSQYLEEGLGKKNQGSLTELNLDSRSEHWQQRIDEFKGSPVIGIGFASVDIAGEEGSAYSEEGKVETGSSWLAVLSMTGMLGFLCVAWLFVNAYKSLKRIAKPSPILSGYLFSLLVFWSVHMFAEGYIFGAGSFLFFNFWLLLGVINATETLMIKASALSTFQKTKPDDTKEATC